MRIHNLHIHPKGKEEFGVYSGKQRKIGEDTGRHRVRLQAYVYEGLPNNLRPCERTGGVALYKIYGQALLMFIAKKNEDLVVLHFAEQMGEHQESLATEEALVRMRSWFGL